MLKLIENKSIEVEKICEKDVFGTRILSNLNAYGTEYPFAMFWEQRDEKDDLTAVISKIDNDITVCCNSVSDIDEIAEFIKIVGFNSILIDECYINNFNSYAINKGIVMQLKKFNDILIFNNNINLIKTVDLSRIYDIILKYNKANEILNYEAWLLDTSHKIRHSCADVLALEFEESIAACAFATAITENCAIIGAVAVLPEYQNRGFGTAVVSKLCSKLQPRKIYLCCDEDKYNFYKRIGFEKSGGFVTLKEKN